jgi:hypothetical protein
MPNKIPAAGNCKKQGKTIKEKRADKRARPPEGFMPKRRKGI